VGDFDDNTPTELSAITTTLEKRDRGYLIVLSGSNVGEMYKVQRRETVVGRGKRADFRVIDDGSSREHFRIRDDEGGYVVEDLGSRNGTFLNGERVNAPSPLRDGDRVKFGHSTVLKFSFHDSLDESFHQKLFESALRDGLTRLFNRRYFLDRLDRELKFARRHNAELSVLLLDIDNFKHINDSFGHAAGDAVLVTVAEVLQRALRNEDVPARIGGEEFAIILRATTKADSLTIADRLRRLVLSAVTEIGGDVRSQIRVSVSVGVAALASHPTATPEQLMTAADEAMYRAKGAGRNRVNE
jgi:diguanylate cyclase (GGDEF)-like protein